jgi:UDP-2,3-diacylglucosamine pyrophosphatase LpxH
MIVIRYWALTSAMITLLGMTAPNARAINATSLPPAPTPRPSVFISDLHFGVGRDKSTGQWHPMEDFRWKEEFELFLSEINRRGGGNTDLILNGDTFELWQSLNTDCAYKDPDLGCTEEEVYARLEHILQEHKSEIDALASFARSSNNYLYIIPGNHDAGLLFNTVKAKLLKEMSTPERVSIVDQGYWESPDSQTYAEHGHQIGKDVNSWGDNWPKPFLSVDGKTYLKRPWGEKFVQDYYNEFEAKYPIIDNISDEGEGVRYAKAAEGPASTVKDIAGFVTFFLFKVSWDQFTSSLTPESGKKTPEWDVNAIQQGGPKFLLDSMPSDNPFYLNVKAALNEGRLNATFQKLSPEDIKLICNERHARVKRESKLPKAEQAMTSCPRPKGKLAAGAESLLRSRDTVLAEYLNGLRKKLDRPAVKPFSTFIYSHTHKAISNFTPIIKGVKWRPAVFNTGAWQRTITPAQLKIVAGDLDQKDVLQYIQPEDLPKCYSVVLVGSMLNDPESGPRLRYWTVNGKNWQLEKQCNDADLADISKEIKKRRENVRE